MLNEEQRKLCEDNIKLVYSVIHSLKLAPTDDIIQEGMLFLCKAAAAYNPEKAKFSTYAFSYIRGGILMYLNKISKNSYNNVELEDEYVGEEDVSDENILRKSKYIKCRDLVDDKDQLILTLWAYGYNQTDIAKRVGISQPTVSVKLSEIINNIKGELTELGEE